MTDAMTNATTPGKRPAGITALASDDSRQAVHVDAQPAHLGPAEALELNWEVGMLRTALHQRNLWLAGITHDLRTPLTIIRLQTQYLQRRLIDRLTSTTETSVTVEAPATGTASKQRYPRTTDTIRRHREQLGRRHDGRRHRVRKERQMARQLPPERTSEDMQALEEVHAGLARITAAVSSMGTLMDEVADLARAQAGYQPELQRQPTDLVALARDVAAAHQVVPRDPLDPADPQLTAPQRGREHTRVRIQVVALEPQVTGDWDARRLQRVLGNLLENAIKYSPDGGDILVEVGCTRAGPAGEWAVLCVRDEGIGIPAADLPTIFEPFRRGRNVAACASGAPGSGLGLVTVRQIVKEHGGTIQVASELGAGTSFTIHLPLHHGAHDALPER